MAPLQEDTLLVDALRRLAQDCEARSRVTCEVTVSGNMRPFDLTTSIHLYRIAQESIENAIRHARASLIELSWQLTDDKATLKIADNGVGVTNTRRARGALGHCIIHYRARCIGGQLQIAARDSGGTLVACTCPVPRPSR
jgi:signal transduction histidine kinase